MRFADRPKLGLGFRQRDVQSGLAGACARKQKAKSQRRLSGAGRPFDQIHALGGETTTQDLIEAHDAG
jgi:hypothetical protein